MCSDIAVRSYLDHSQIVYSRSVINITVSRIERQQVCFRTYYQFLPICYSCHSVIPWFSCSAPFLPLVTATASQWNRNSALQSIWPPIIDRTWKKLLRAPIVASNICSLSLSLRKISRNWSEDNDGKRSIHSIFREAQRLDAIICLRKKPIIARGMIAKLQLIFRA